jgi:hypothetical protein
MAGVAVALFGGCGAKIAEGEDAHGAGTAARVAGGLGTLHQPGEGEAFAPAYLIERAPQLRLQPHAGAALAGDDVAIDQPAILHPISPPHDGRSLSLKS